MMIKSYIVWKRIYGSNEMYRGGFVLGEVLFSTIIISFLVGTWWWAMSGLLESEWRIQENLLCLREGRYIRQYIAGRVNYGGDWPTILRHGAELDSGKDGDLVYEGHQLYRKLSNGEFYPLSGNFVGGSKSPSRIEMVGDRPIFQFSEDGVVSFTGYVRSKRGRYEMEMAQAVCWDKGIFHILDAHHDNMPTPALGGNQ